MEADGNQFGGEERGFRNILSCNNEGKQEKEWKYAILAEGISGCKRVRETVDKDTAERELIMPRVMNEPEPQAATSTLPYEVQAGTSLKQSSNR
eukprot:442775-Hanusia_phi.AAC.1